MSAEYDKWWQDQVTQPFSPRPGLSGLEDAAERIAHAAQGERVKAGDGAAITEKPWADMTLVERREEMDRAAAELLRRLRGVIPELEAIAADVETIRREIDEARDSLAGIRGLSS